RIKDVVSFQGIRDNILIGYGLVVGLNGSGDKNVNYTNQGLKDFLQRLGVSIDEIKDAKNVAAVSVTAVLPPFARQGSRIDVTVSTLGNAKSLQDGTLLATPLLGADGEVYAIAQGTVSVSGFIAGAGEGGNNTQVSKNVTTNAIVNNGAIIEREINFSLSNLDRIKLALHNPDITTSLQIADTINFHNNRSLAQALDPGTVELKVPEDSGTDVLRFLAGIEQLIVRPDMIAKILVDESTGTIVMGENVRISPVAVAQGNISIVIVQRDDVSQPNPFADGSSQVYTNFDVIVDEEQTNRMTLLNQTATLGELVYGLNALGVGPRDMITILYAIKSAGALQAVIEVK
ncbi:MAG: flagellar basal body P-ring protein FlgI, partial [Pseudomonadota bacterium]